MRYLLNAPTQKHLGAQKILIAKTENEVFRLETEIKENEPKVQRLKDYEKRIEHMTAMLKLW